MRPHRLIPTATSIALALFILLAAFKDIKAQQATVQVEAVEVLGNRRLTDGDILKHIRTRPGQAFNMKQIQLDLESIIKLGVFDKTQARVSTEAGLRGGIVVLFMVAELPMIKSVKVEGVKPIDEIGIIELLREKPINIVKGALFDPVRVRRAMRVIKEFLTSHYWSNVTVTIRQENETSTEVSLTFLIEGDDYSFREAVRDFSSQKNRLISFADTRH